MAEPDNLILEHLRAIRAKLGQRLGEIGQNVEAVELKLDGLTHAVIAGYAAGGMIRKSGHRFSDKIMPTHHKSRMGRIETERA